MNEREFTDKVVQALNQSADDLPASTLYQLQAIRQKALAQAQIDPPQGWALSWKWAIPATGLVVFAVGYLMLQRDPVVDESYVRELEAQLLVDELPLHAYLDEGFEQWVKKTSHGSR